MPLLRQLLLDMAKLQRNKIYGSADEGANQARSNVCSTD